LLSEQKALKRFIFIYLFSTLILIAIGEYFYIQTAYKNIIAQEKSSLQKQLTQFLKENLFLNRRVRFKEFKIPKNSKVLIYQNQHLIYSNSSLLDVFVEQKEIKPFGEIKIVITGAVNKKRLKNLKNNLIFFNLFLLLFLLFISVWLGKIFLQPMKETITAMENFITDATHEMNTPISIILTNIELLKEESRHIKRIKNSTLRLYKIFNDLKYLKLYHQHKKRVERYNFLETLLERLELFQTQIDNKKLTIQKEIEEFFINIDREDMIRIIDNLLSNAIKYAPYNSTIIVFLKEKRFCVTNSGKIENIEKLTNKFYRENQNEGGFGLGLFIVEQIAKEYKFQLKIKNINQKVEVCLTLV
jgi:two-component system OmpR family sensor kinase